MVKTLEQYQNIFSNSDLAEIAHFQTRKGDSFYRWISFKENGIPEDLTGNNYLMVISDENLDSLIEFSSENDISIHFNVLVINVSSETISTLNIGSFNYDLKQIDSLGNVTTRMSGKFIVNQNYI